MIGFAIGLVVLLLSTHFIYRATGHRQISSLGSLALTAVAIALVDQTPTAIAAFTAILALIAVLRLKTRSGKS